MKLFALVCLVLFSISFVVASNAVPQEILNGFFAGRSQEALVGPRSIPESDSVLFLDSSSEPFKATSIKDKDVADLGSHLLGSSPINIEASRSDFPHINFFKRPLANIFFVVDWVGQELISQLSLNFPGQKIALKKTHFPSNSLSDLTTLATGSSPSSHGIISSFWEENGLQVEAFSYFGQSAVPNFADVLNANFEGRAQIVVASGDHQMTSALCPQSNQICVSLSADLKMSTPLPEQSSGNIQVTEKSIIETLTSSKAFKKSSGLSTSYKLKQNVVQVAFENTVVDFHLSNKQEFNFIAELELARAFRSELKSQVVDGAPCHFAFAFSSLKPLLETHGADSDLARIAVRMVHAIILDTIETSKSVFEDRVVTEVVLLGTHESYPASTSSDLDLSKFEIYQIPKHLSRQVRSVQVEYGVTNGYYNNANATITLMDMANFHICLWVPIVLALLLIVFVYTMSEVSGDKRDTLLYATGGARPHAN